jgi:hypothetical protein
MISAKKMSRPVVSRRFLGGFSSPLSTATARPSCRRGRFASEWVAAFRRNHWPLSLGFRNAVRGALDHPARRLPPATTAPVRARASAPHRRRFRPDVLLGNCGSSSASVQCRRKDAARRLVRSSTQNARPTRPVRDCATCGPRSAFLASGRLQVGSRDRSNSDPVARAHASAAHSSGTILSLASDCRVAVPIAAAKSGAGQRAAAGREASLRSLPAPARKRPTPWAGPCRS